MKIFTNKNLIQKLVIALVFVTLLNFCFAPKVRAEFGGKMMGYIRDFATALADVAISVVQFGMTGQWTYAVDDKGAAETDSSKDYWIKDSKIRYPIIQISPELIFADKVELLSVDFIGGSQGKQYTLKTNSQAISTLRTIIASWYVTLRTIAIVGLLSVLIYIGIRIIISSTSQDRAKYKQRLVDWIIAFCLLFFMHYIMAATVNVIGQVNSVLGDNLVSKGIPLNAEHGNVKYDLAAVSEEDRMTLSQVGTTIVNAQTMAETQGRVYCNGSQNYLSNAITLQYVRLVSGEFEGTGHDVYILKYATVEDLDQSVMEQGTLEIRLNLLDDNGTYYVKSGTAISSDESIFKTEEIKNYLKNVEEQINSLGIKESEPTANPNYKNTVTVTSKSGSNVIVAEDSINTGSSILYYINYARLYLNVSTVSKYVPISVGYLIIYMVLVVFTGMFAVRYMKRVIYVAFLTLIAPMVAMTYPLDKIKDRKSTSI